MCWGRRIPANAQVAGHRHKSMSRGKAKIPSGRAMGMKILYKVNENSDTMPIFKQPPDKGLHLPKDSLSKGIQNAG